MAEVAEQAQRRQANQQQNQEQAGSLVEQFGHSMHDAWTLTALGGVPLMVEKRAGADS